MSDLPMGKKPTRVERWSEETRRLILWVSVGLLTLIIVIAWLFNLQGVLRSVESQPTDTSALDELQQNLTNFLDAASEALNPEETASTTEPTDRLPSAGDTATSSATTSPIVNE